jgi:hypothetical protein
MSKSTGAQRRAAAGSVSTAMTSCGAASAAMRVSNVLMAATLAARSAGVIAFQGDPASP